MVRLHGALEVVMGWYGEHLRQSEAGGFIYGTRNRERGRDLVSEAKVTIARSCVR